MIVNPPAISEIKKQLDYYFKATENNPREALKALEELRQDINVKINVLQGHDHYRNTP